MTNGPGQTVAGLMGNVLESYDFTLYGAFADVVARVFFPPPDDDAPVAAGEGRNVDYDGLVKAFAVNSGAFLARPLGGVLIGYVGDKYGRKRALVLSLYLMAAPTFAMGCLPTYEQVGGLSTFLLVLCRLLQGVSLGGQVPASMTYTIETRTKERMDIFMDEMIYPPIENAYWINTAALLFGVTLPIPLAGHLSDIYGRLNLMAIGALGLGAFGPVAVLIISRGNGALAFLAQVTIGWLLALFEAPVAAWLLENFPAKVRMTSGALGFDLASATASAFAPLIATALVENVSLAAPGIIYPFFAVVSLCGMSMSTGVHRDGGLEDIRAGENNEGNELDLKDKGEEGMEPKTSPIV